MRTTDKGKILGLSILAFAVAFGAILYYYQTTAYYERIRNIYQIETVRGPIEVQEYDGIDADTSPIKLRACFRASPEKLQTLPQVFDVTPLVAPKWFDCFDAGQLTADLAARRATAYLAADDSPAGSAYSIQRFIAAYPDGRAYMWRQISE